jgi:hypothetical protein
MNRRGLILAAIVFGWAVQALPAQELSTDAERSYRELRKSHDAKTQLLGERWYNAVRLQEWTNKSGQFKTTAKYVEHDPDLAWVKLRIIQGSGDTRLVKDVMIPLVELDKVCQARVRQIGVLAEKVAAAAAAEKDDESTEKSADGATDDVLAGRAKADEQRNGLGGRAAGLSGMDAEEARTEVGGARPARPAARRPSPRATNRAPLPALLPPLPAGAARFGQAASTPKGPPAAPAERRQR